MNIGRAKVVEVEGPVDHRARVELEIPNGETRILWIDRHQTRQARAVAIAILTACQKLDGEKYVLQMVKDDDERLVAEDDLEYARRRV